VKVFLVNPSDIAFGVGVITPRWLYVLAAATPRQYGDPRIVDETLEAMDLDEIQAGDIVGIGIHTANVLRGMEVGRQARARGAFVIYGGIHSTLYPQEPFELGGAHAVVKGDGDVIFAQVLDDVVNGRSKGIYDGGRVDASAFRVARWDLMPADRYMFASVQTVRGCPKHCSFCSVWRTDGQKPRQRASDPVIEEVVALRRLGYRFIVLADDNFYPVTITDIHLAEKQGNVERVNELKSIRDERFDLMRRLAQLPSDMVFFTQITMEAAEDTAFLDAMREARVRGALVGVEAVTPEGLKAVYKDFNLAGDNLIERLKVFREHGVYILGSFIFGLSTDRDTTFQATADLAKKADLSFAQFVMMTPFPGTVDFQKWEKNLGDSAPTVNGTPINRYWLIPPNQRPKLYIPHPTMSQDEIRQRTQAVWDTYYAFPEIWKRAKVVKSLKARLAFVGISKLYRQMYANTGIATDSARKTSANRWARWFASFTRRMFVAKPMPELQVPERPSMPGASPFVVLGD